MLDGEALISNMNVIDECSVRINLTCATIVYKAYRILEKIPCGSWSKCLISSL